MNVCLSFPWCLLQTATGIKYAEVVVPWGKLVKYLNGIAQFPFEVRLVGDQMPWSNDIGWTPEDILIRGQIWSQSFYPPSFFADCPTEEDERNIPRATLEKSRRHRCLWLGVRLSSVRPPYNVHAVSNTVHSWNDGFCTTETRTNSQ